MNQDASPSGGLTALVLAGRRAGTDDPLASLGVAQKGLIKIAERPMLYYVLRTLQSVPSISQILISAPDDAQNDIKAVADSVFDGLPPRWQFVDPKPSPSQSIAATLKNGAAQQEFIVTTSDHPLLNPMMIDQFLSAIDKDKINAAAACVTRDVYEEKFPGTRRTFIQLNDFKFSGANLFWFRGAETLPLLQFWQRLEHNRKHPFKMAAEIGFKVGAKYLFGALTKKDVIERIGQKTKTAIELIPLSEAEAAIDVDKLEDVKLVEEIIRQHSRT